MTRSWESIECWDCNGFGIVDRGYHDPDECRTCGGSGSVVKYRESGVVAKYAGGPILGRDKPLAKAGGAS
jgi:DnaJ-class molecular chaperone